MIKKEIDKHEAINTALHGFGVVLSIIGLLLLIFKSYNQNYILLVSFVIFGLSMIAVYSSSTLLHFNLAKNNKKRIYSVLDYSAIYLLIAGTYTPFTLITLNNTIGYILLAIVWTMAVIGIIYQCYFWGTNKFISTLSYIVAGWTIILGIKSIFQNIEFNGFLLLALGGIFYTAGSYFYYFDAKSKFNHAIWHVFVLLGTVSHYLSVLLYVK